MGGHDDNTEFMWVELVSRNETNVTGLLMSNPRFIPDLAPGAEVTKAIDEAFDFIWEKADGTQEGNETSEIILRLQQGR